MTDRILSAVQANLTRQSGSGSGSDSGSGSGKDGSFPALSMKAELCPVGDCLLL